MTVRGVKRLRRALRLLRNRLMPGGLILLYHRVAEVQSDPWLLSVTPRHFAEQLEVLRKVGRPMRLCQLAQNRREGKFQYRPLVVTFDDGYADNLYNGKPLLERYEIPATIFLTTGCMGQDREFWWDELDRLLLQPKTLPRTLHIKIDGSTHDWDLGEAADYGEDIARHYDTWTARDKHDPSARHSLYRSLYHLLQPLSVSEQRRVLDDLLTWSLARPGGRPSYRPLTVQEILTLAQCDLVDIGSHTITHPVFSAHPTATQRQEIQQSKAHLEEILGCPVKSFAYPYGGQSTYTAETVTLVREAGFACACSASAGVVRRGADPFRLPRLHVEDWDGDKFTQVLLRWLDG
jgi:peptidoglycan/xylan/chitin deacetylase (PgdA/CDA1 family)